MARLQGVLIPLLGAVFLANAGAQEGKATPMRSARGGAAARMDSPEFENVRKAIEALTPEQRKRFQENFARWATLSPEEKKSLRDQNEVRRKKIKDEVDGVLTSAGVQLSEEQRVQFARRYIDERRKLEEQLRKETEEKRQAAVSAIIAKLKQEFTATTPGAAATSAVSDGSPSSETKP